MGQNEQDKQDNVTLEELEKSWEDSRANVLALLGEEPSIESVEKADKEEMDYDEEEEDDDDEDEDEEVEKSIEEQLEENPEASAAMDVEPFLRDMAKAMDARMDAIEKSVANAFASVGNVLNLQKATARMFAAFGELQKSTAETVEKIGGTPIPSRSVVRATGQRFEKSQDEPGEVIELNMTREQILEKSLRLREAGKLQIRDVSKIEGRLNKGMELPEDIKRILIKEEV